MLFENPILKLLDRTIMMYSYFLAKQLNQREDSDKRDKLSFGEQYEGNI